MYMRYGMLVIQARIFYRNSDSIFFTKNDDNGDNFSNLTKINGHIKSIGKPQIILYKNNIHVI